MTFLLFFFFSITCLIYHRQPLESRIGQSVFAFVLKVALERVQSSTGPALSALRAQDRKGIGTDSV